MYSQQYKPPKHLGLKQFKDDTGHSLVYCGPVALATVTGYSLDIVEHVIRCNQERSFNPRSRRQVRGTTPSEMLDAFRSFGCDLRPTMCGYIANSQGRTLRYYLMSRSHTVYEQTLLIEVTGHWVVVKGKHFFDSNVAVESKSPVLIKDAPKLGARVKAVMEITLASNG